MTDNNSTYENALVVDNDMLQVTDADTMIETTQNGTETVLIIDESQNNQETENITSDSVIIVDNIKNQEITEEVTITEVYTSDYQGI